MSHMSRRQAMALGSAGALGISACTATNRVGALGVASTAGLDLGWDQASETYTLPPLPYAYDALEPWIDEQTMRIHHDKHHAGYVKGLNKALKQLDLIRAGSGDPGLIKHWSRELAFHGSGHVNHTLFWDVMRPGGATEPVGDLAKAIDRDFGSFAQFIAHFKLASAKVEGSGWGWLVHHAMSNKLLVLQGEKQQDMTINGVIPLMGVDVWEHAYYLKYQNRRSDYIDAFMRVLNWSVVGERYAALVG